MLKIKRIVVENRRQGDKYLSLTVASGRIEVSSQACKDFGITDAHKAVFFQNEENPSEWYFSFGEKGDYPLNNYKGKGKYKSEAHGFTNRSFQNMILESMGLPKKTVRLHLSTEPIVLEEKKLWRLNYRK